jgi:SAM-dependent methyltransferase
MPAWRWLDALTLRWFPRTRPAPLAPIVYWARRSTPTNRLVRLLYGCVRWNYDLVTAERIVEVPFILRHLDAPAGARVLDFGASESPIALHLVSLGYRVVAVDLRPYPFSHPNLTVRQGDFLSTGLPNDSFDAAIALSVVEHCGLGAYDEPMRPAGDRLIVDELFRVLAPRGRLLLTVPYGRAGQTSWYRVYDRPRLTKLLERFTVLATEYYRGIQRKHWLPASEADIAEVDSITPGFVQGVACVVAMK